MVNVFQRLTRRRAPSSGSKTPESGSNAQSAPFDSHALHRTASANSAKRNRLHDRAAHEPVSRHLILISDTPGFDPEIIRRFREEAFDVQYLPFKCTDDPDRDRRALENAVHEKEDDLEAGERFAIVAYNRPAFYLLASHHLINSSTNPFPRLCALIAYYPVWSKEHRTERKRRSSQEDCTPACGDTESIFMPGPSATLLPIQIHIPDQTRESCTFWPWITLSASEGDMTYKKRHRCHVFRYPDSPSLVEGALSNSTTKDVKGIGNQTGDETNSSIAWSRTLGCLRRAFGVGSHWPVLGIETVWEKYWERLLGDLEQKEKGDPCNHMSWSALEIMSGLHEDPDEYGLSIDCVPTGAGGSDPPTLKSFFDHVFIASGPKSQHFRLISRTVGSDRIVDEVRFSFKHTADIPWLLPGISPTNRDISVVVVIVASFSADRIIQQKLYWDQADVLVQAGILDAALVRKIKTTT